MDGRRHSLDIPISKTLMALRRVRSLRDPSTNSMSKFSALVDNLNWETNLNNEFTLGCLNGCEERGKGRGIFGQMDERFNDFELRYDPENPITKLISGGKSVLRSAGCGTVPIRTEEIVESANCTSNQEMVDGNKLMIGRQCCGCKDNGPSTDHLKGLVSCNPQVERSLHEEIVEYNASKEKIQYRNKIRAFIGSPYLSMSDTSMEELNVVDDNYDRCGKNRCWSGTQRFGETNGLSESDDLSLLSGEVGGTLLSGHIKSWKHISDEISQYSGGLISFSQKFRPKSFNELVGQNVVTRSLSSAIANGRVTPIYLFHGPRGTGKTSASRIFAAALNCLSVDEHRPCGLCSECVLLFSGRSRDVKEVDIVEINRRNGVMSLLKNAAIRPVSSRFKVFIIDECHLLHEDTWMTLVNSLKEISRHIVFLMITPDLDKLPKSAVSCSQIYHFQKIKEADIASRLGRICVEEGLDFEQNALEFIATRSNGSLRDAEMILEQLSLLDKRITVSLVYELIGTVSEDELLELLDLALSSEASQTISRTRELLRSRIDPMQLTSQLANLIMDILAGNCREGTSEVRRMFFEKHIADMQQLGNALKILSETEKQLRTSKNQTTWLTASLLQLSSAGSPMDANDSRLSTGTGHVRDGEYCSTLAKGGSQDIVSCATASNEPDKFWMVDGYGTLETIWKRATEICQPVSLGFFLRKRGKLSSLCFNQGLAVAELEFDRPGYASKAEKSWKLIANAFQSILDCNVEIRIINHVASPINYSKTKLCFCFFSCPRGKNHHHRESQSTNKRGSDLYEEPNTTTAVLRVVMSEGNELGIRTPVPHSSNQCQTPVARSSNQLCSCFPKILKFPKKFWGSFV